MVSQMNRIVGDHLTAGFIVKVEYREIKDEQGLSDFLIRYYPGKAAKESVRRVLSFINSSTLPIIAARRRNRREKIASRLISRPKHTEVGESNVGQPLMEGKPQEALEAENRLEVTVDGELLEALTTRQVMRSGAIRLLTAKSPEELAAIQDYVDYWDSIRGEKQPGLLVSLIQKHDPLPASFQTRRQRQIRQESEERHQRIRAVKDRLTTAYADRRRNAIDNFVIAELGADEFEHRVEARKNELSAQGGLWEQMSPNLADNMARSDVRTEIAKTLSIISFEDFQQREIPKLLVDFELCLADFGLEVPPTTSDGAANTHPNALYATPTEVPPKDMEPPLSKANSSPGAL
jgi:hypothetical protein